MKLHELYFQRTSEKIDERLFELKWTLIFCFSICLPYFLRNMYFFIDLLEKVSKKILILQDVFSQKLIYVWQKILKCPLNMTTGRNSWEKIHTFTNDIYAVPHCIEGLQNQLTHQ